MYIVIDNNGNARIFKYKPQLCPVYEKELIGVDEDLYGKPHEIYKDTTNILYYEWIDYGSIDSCFGDCDRNGYVVDILSFSYEIRKMKHEDKPIKI